MSSQSNICLPPGFKRDEIRQLTAGRQQLVLGGADQSLMLIRKSQLLLPTTAHLQHSRP